MEMVSIVFKCLFIAACTIFIFCVSSAEDPSEANADQLPLQDGIKMEVLSENTYGELLAGPARTEDFPAWLAAMRSYRREMQERLAVVRNGMKDPYGQPELQWTHTSFVQPLMMAHDRYFYDPITRKYTVNRYLADLEKRYGGIDSILIWPTYPNIGIDNRNQYDLWHDMPGGIAGLREMVAEFHRHDVRVLLPIMYWDHGTRDEGTPMPQRLAELAKEIGADGLNGDTMSPVTREFYTESLKVGHPLAMEPENGLAGEIDSLAWNIMSWGYWWPYQPKPAVDRYKFIEPRHLTHVCDRWAHDRTDMLQYAYFNGAGYESWENVWGIWNGVTPRDAEALRRISTIYRAVPELLVSLDYEPFTPVLHKGVFATRFPVKDKVLYTFINRTDSPAIGKQIQTPYRQGMRFFDLWRGIELKPDISGETAVLSFDIDPHGFGAVLALDHSPDTSVKALLAKMKKLAQTELATLSHKWEPLPQRMVEIPPTKAVSDAPEGMVSIPAGMYHFESTGIMVEKSEGVGVQYPWETQPELKHNHDIDIKAFCIDRCPVTCAEFKRFIDATHYHPKDDHNFLKVWVDGAFPDGWAKKPVTWVSLEDARAYAAWAGKRLPHEWEWQYAAQGTDDRAYPWGAEKDAGRVPPFEHGRDQRPPTDVDAYPSGASPFGVMDLTGNVWQWTDEFVDDHTRAAVLKGGSYYRPDKSDWYYPQAHELTQHGKYLLLSPGIDRSASIGFRCVVDAQ